MSEGVEVRNWDQTSLMAIHHFREEHISGKIQGGINLHVGNF